MAQTAHTDPFGEGLMVTGMLLTTLIPTAIHLVDGLRGAMAGPLAHHGPIAERLAKWPTNKPLHHDPEFERQVIAAIQQRQLHWIAYTLLAAVIVAAFWAFVIYLIPNLGQFLFDVAHCGNAFEDYSCAPVLRDLGLG
jgi:hypothetical protein